MKLICSICNNLIDESDAYFEIRLHQNRILEATEFCHKECRHKHDQINQSMSAILKSMQGLIKPLVQEGVEYEIK